MEGVLGAHAQESEGVVEDRRVGFGGADRRAGADRVESVGDAERREHGGQAAIPVAHDGQAHSRPPEGVEGRQRVRREVESERLEQDPRESLGRRGGAVQGVAQHPGAVQA